MNVYDFDDTLYKGDSTQAFFRFLYKRHPKMLLHLPKQCKAFLRFLVGIDDKTAMKETLYGAFAYVQNIEDEVERFWQQEKKHFKTYYQTLHAEDDVVISASPRFLLEPAMRNLEIRHLLASEVDPRTGKTTGANCHGKEKLHRFTEAGYDIHAVDCFYSDSLADAPFANVAKKAFLVDGEHLYPWHAVKEPYLVSRSVVKLMLFSLPMSVLLASVGGGIGVLLTALLATWYLYNRTTTKPLACNKKGVARFLTSFGAFALLPYLGKKLGVRHPFLSGYSLASLAVFIFKQVSKR